MKKNLLFSSLFLMVFMTNVDGQVWFQEGDTWVYNYSYYWGEEGYEEVWVEGDTMIEGQSCKILKNKITKVLTGLNPSNDTIVSVNAPYFLYEESDSIFLYFEDEFKLIYDFSNPLSTEAFIVREGEGHPDECYEDAYFYSIDTTSMLISGANRQVIQYISPEGTAFFDNQRITIIEGIGITNHEVTYANGNTYGGRFGHIIPGKAYGCLFDSYSWNFCSFTSDGEEYNPDDTDCYALPVPVSVDNFSTTPVTYDLYPNPANTHFSVQNLFKLPIKKITIFNANGNVEKMISQPPKEIAISDLAKGVYIVEVEIGDKLVYKKLVKQ